MLHENDAALMFFMICVRTTILQETLISKRQGELIANVTDSLKIDKERINKLNSLGDDDKVYIDNFPVKRDSILV